MARSDAFDGLTEFLAIARAGSFRAAAIELGVTPGAVSQALRALETRLGTPLMVRTTRRIALTEAGGHLLSQLGPAADIIAGTLETLSTQGPSPAGTLRLLVHTMALQAVLRPVLPAFRQRWPRLKIEVTVDATHADLVSGGYDAGIRVGEFIARDMIALRVSQPFRWMVVGAPGYFARHGRPATPEDIARHECIRYRRPDRGDVYRWEFQRGGQGFSIDPPGAVVVNDGTLLATLAAEGAGLAYTSTLSVAGDLARGALETVLEPFSPPADSLYLYFPRASRGQPKLRAFVEACTRCTR
ncbi:LysR family transcriptional regulator [Pseudoxanthobacter sp.]|uniref:LysR family transcriptional regulator n=1 Tax=Pseudoxanthobacter sp. TaxID=1925742 RepID=UPI002FE1C0AD